MNKAFKFDLTWKQRGVAMLICTVVYASLLYLFTTNQSVKIIIIQGVIWGVLFVLIFPWTMKKLVGTRLNTITPELLAEEQIAQEIGASLFRGLEAVGGKIFLTNKRLIFQSHSFNVQKGQTNIAFSDINNVAHRKTMKLINNGIKISTIKGEEYCFVVNNSAVQIEKIKSKLL